MAFSLGSPYGRLTHLRRPPEATPAPVPVEGVCLYPILDRFDWDDDSHWHNCGLWDLSRNDNGEYARVLNAIYARELNDAQNLRLEELRDQLDRSLPK